MEYSFRITNLYCYPTYQSLDNVVFTIMWEYTGTDGTYSANVSGSTQIPYSEEVEYTPFENLTETQVMSWIEQYTEPAALSDMQTQIEASVVQQSAPPAVINPILPWNI